MADYATLKAAIQAVIYENGNQEITGSVMQATLLTIVNSLGANYQYAGIATPSTNPGTPDQNVFYLASTAGTYVNFGNIVLAENEVAILKYNGSWTKEASGFASAEKVSQLEAEVDGKDNTATASFDITANASNTYYTGDYASINLPAGTYSLSYDDTIVKSGAQLWVKYVGTNTWVYINTFANLAPFTLANDVDTIGLWVIAAQSLKTATLVLTFTDTTKGVGLKSRVSALETDVADLDLIVKDGKDNSTDFVKEVTESESFSKIYAVDIKRGTYALTYTNTIGVETGTYLRYYYEGGTYDQTANIGASGNTTITFNSDVVAIRIMTIGFESAGTITMHFEDSNKIYSLEDQVDALADDVADNTEDIAELQDLVGLNSVSKYLRTTGDITTGEELTLGENNVEINKHLSFVGYFSAFGTLRIGHGYNIDTAGWIEIDSTNLYIFRGTSLTAIATKAHGLTIANNIQVSIVVDDLGRPTFTIQSMGERYSFTHYMWYGIRGSIFAKSVSGTYEDCTLSWTTDGYNSDIHIYGDSYCSNLNQTRWPYYLIQDNYNDILLDAYSGRASTAALARFLENIEHSKPKFALWLMGMNDADTDSEINSTWQTKTQDFIAKCNEKKITPILATIPNVPARVMTFKNAWVKASGYRYIDFAKAVNAESAGATWYTGMLSEDNLHPSALGAKTLYYQVLADFPEIMAYAKVAIGGNPPQS